MKASDILERAIGCIKDRGARYNTGEERSMGAAVAAFNAITGRDLAEAEGWLLMVQIKLAREQGSPADPDHTIDGAGYMGLYGESRLRDAGSPAEGPSFVSIGEERADGDAAERAHQWAERVLGKPLAGEPNGVTPVSREDIDRIAGASFQPAYTYGGWDPQP